MTTAGRGPEPWGRSRRILRLLAERLSPLLEDAATRLVARMLGAPAPLPGSPPPAGAGALAPTIGTDGWVRSPAADGRVVVRSAGDHHPAPAPVSRPRQLAGRAPAGEELATLADIATAEAALACAHVPASLLVSVVVVTTDWPESLAAAIASVRRQSYPAWELVVVDGGQGPPPALGDHDGKIRVVAGGAGAAAAHNRGLEAATGQLVAHLGDRSEMARHWLRAVASTLVDWPGTEVVVGHRVTFAGEGDPGADLVAACCAGRLALGAGGTLLDVSSGGTLLDGVVYRRDLAAARMVDGPAPDPLAHLAGLVALPTRRRVPYLATITRAALTASREAAGALAWGGPAPAATFPGSSADGGQERSRRAASAPASTSTAARPPSSTRNQSA